MNGGTDGEGLEGYRRRITRQKREALIGAAKSLFLAQGYDSTSLSQIADRAGVSTATLYKHYPTKADLFGDIMASMWDGRSALTADWLPKGDPRAALRSVGRDYAALLGEAETVALFKLIISEASRFPELGRELYNRGKKPYLDQLESYLAREVSAGHLAIDNIPVAARQFLGMINDVVFWPRFLIIDLVIDEQEAARIVEEAVTTFLARYRSVAVT